MEISPFRARDRLVIAPIIHFSNPRDVHSGIDHDVRELSWDHEIRVQRLLRRYCRATELSTLVLHHVPLPLQIEPRTSITALAWSIAARKTHVASRGVIECFCQDTRQVYADLDYRLTVTYTGTPWIADEFRYK